MKADVLIIGGGPAGLSAGIFTCRAGLNTILLEGTALGGKANLSYEVTNYPGRSSISGYDLMQEIISHATTLGLKIEYESATRLKSTKSGFSIKTKNNTYTANKVIIACGCKERKLSLENEEKFVGRGISFCASCDGMFYRGKTVAVVGGGNTAIDDVKYLSRLAQKVYIINRRDKFRAGEHQLEKIKKLKNVVIIPNAVVTKLHGDERLEGVTINENGSLKELQVDGLFEAIGSVPDLEFIDIELEKDDLGYIKVNERMETSENNLFACGDIISKNFRQIVTACADGAIAGNECIEK